jgi:transcriptional regulator with XRE-family HTH domain
VKLWLPASENETVRLLAERIKSLRRSMQWSQEELAERASLQRSYLADLERGYRNPSVRTLVKIANAMHVSVAALFERGIRRQ